MSHFSVLVLVPDAPDDPEQAVTPLLAPYDESGEWFRDESRWDWWQVGGGWTGSLDGYDPNKDEENIEVCDICNGTGKRPDADRFEASNPGWIEWSGGCNGCQGEGKRTSWPTQWKGHEGDVQPVRLLLSADEPFVPAALVTPDGKWHEQARMGWFGCTIEDEDGEGEKPEELWRATVRALLEQHPEATAVLVDCHV